MPKHKPQNYGASISTLQALMASGLNPRALRTNALLRKDEWKALDTAILDIVRKRLVGVSDLTSRGLVRNLGGLGVMTDEWEAIQDMSGADVDMSGATASGEDTVQFSTQGVPIPIIHKGYRLEIRRLEASRKTGAALDTTQAEIAARKVRDKMEDMLFNGYSLKSDGYNIYGYTTFPYRLRTNIGTAWDAASPDPVGDVAHMLDVARAKHFYGPFVLYVPNNYWGPLLDDYSTYKDGTYYDRIKQYPEIEDIKMADVLGSAEVVLVQLTRDVVDLAVGQDVTNVEWMSQGGMIQHNKVLAAMAPRLKYAYDEDGNQVTGIVHAFESATSTTTTA